MRNITIIIEAVVVNEDVDEIMAATQAVGAALKNNGVFAVDRISVDTDNIALATED